MENGKRGALSGAPLFSSTPDAAENDAAIRRIDRVRRSWRRLVPGCRENGANRPGTAFAL
jgi:hypothetical protein